jgi:hypothetical protein
MQTQIINDNSCIRIVNDNLPVLVNKAQIKTIDTAKNEMVRIDIGEGPLKQIYIKFSEVTVPAGLADVNALRDAIKAMMDSSCAGSGVAVDLTPLVNVAQSELAKVTEVKGSIDALTQQVITTGQAHNDSILQVNTGVSAISQQVTASSDTQTRNLSAVKLSVDAVSTGVAAAGAIQHDAIVAVTDSVNAFKLDQATLIGNLGTLMLQIKNILSGANDPFKNPVFLDDTEPGNVYYGYIDTVVVSTNSIPPSAVPAFAIQKISKDRSGVLTYQWANGNRQFTNIWDNRAVLQYQMYVQQP